MSKEITKIYNLDELTSRLDSVREGKRVVLCHGCFDLFHAGHLHYLKEAAGMGDLLVVTVSPDRFVDKGPFRPKFTESVRAETIAAMSMVDFVAINEWPTAVETIELIKPDVYAKGADFKSVDDDLTGKLGLEADAVKRIGGELVITSGPIYSSTTLINRYFSPLPESVKSYLLNFRDRIGIDGVATVLEQIRSIRALVVGDVIVDDYHFCDGLGVSSKDSVLAIQHRRTETYAGGAVAVANHMAHFVDRVDFIGVVGDSDEYASFVNSKFHPNVHPVLFPRAGKPTTVKRRFVDAYSLKKFLEIYIMDDHELAEKDDAEFIGLTRDLMKNCDLVVASDYGHGCISARHRGILSDQSPFLAVNTQANAGNRGLHTISRYQRMDYGCIAQNEFKAELRDYNCNVRSSIASLTKAVNAKCMTVTQGKKGCIVYEKERGLVEAPAFNLDAVDRVGAGDALLAITAPAACAGVDLEILAFLGNLMGGLAVGIIGNSRSVDREQMETAIRSLLK
jgi:rfaE bifunctional protein kinase chain/domain/rfaE bifunctional protein nucleotidyltransferase chain/domain